MRVETGGAILLGKTEMEKSQWKFRVAGPVVPEMQFFPGSRSVGRTARNSTNKGAEKWMEIDAFRRANDGIERRKFGET
jgi:hypothetical protein